MGYVFLTTLVLTFISIEGRIFNVSKEGTSIRSFGPHDATTSNIINLYAGYSVDNNFWHGVKAKMSVWDIPNVKPGSASMAFIAAGNSQADRGEIISAGVHVHPGLYNDNKLHFFTYWTTDKGQTTGCFNEQCPGFIIAGGGNLLPGQTLAPLSTYNEQERYITLRIKKDEKTGDWSLYREDKGGPIGGMTLLGWWPKTLFRFLSDYATRIEWSGYVAYRDDEPSPPMGSGHFAEEGEKKAAYFYDILGFNTDGKKVHPQYVDFVTNIDKKQCYDVSEMMGTSWDGGQSFYYGGPSGC